MSDIHPTRLETYLVTSEVFEIFDELDEFDSRVENTFSHDSEPLNAFEPFTHEFESTSKSKKKSSVNQNLPLHLAERISHDLKWTY